MCYTIYGDKYVTPDEQCDDGNLIFEDGGLIVLSVRRAFAMIVMKAFLILNINELKFRITIKILDVIHHVQNAVQFKHPFLFKYIEGYGCLVCSTGFYKVDNVCYSIYGDNQRFGDEYCDDANSYFEDGCHQWSFGCPMSCSNYNQGVCYVYHKGFLYYKHQCFEFANKFLPNNSNLVIDSTFINKPTQINRIQAKIFKFPQQLYDSIGLFVEGMNSLYPFLTMEIVFKYFQIQQKSIEK